MAMNTPQFLAFFCRLSFSVLAVCASVWLHSEEGQNAPSSGNRYFLDGVSGFWMAASILFIASIAFERMVLSSSATNNKIPQKKYGGYCLYLIGAIFLFIASIWYFAVPRMQAANDSNNNNNNSVPRDLVAGFTIAAGLFAFLGQIIIAIQLRQSALYTSRLHLVATFLGVFASFLYFLGGIFWLEEVIVNAIQSFEPESDDYYEALKDYIDHLRRINDRIAACLITGSVFFLLNAIVMGIAFSKDDDDEEEGASSKEKKSASPSSYPPEDVVLDVEVV